MVGPARRAASQGVRFCEFPQRGQRQSGFTPRSDLSTFASPHGLVCLSWNLLCYFGWDHKDRVALIANYCTILVTFMTICSAAVGSIDFILNHRGLLAVFADSTNVAAAPSSSTQESLDEVLKGTEFDKPKTDPGMTHFSDDDLIGRFFAGICGVIGRWIEESPGPALTFLIGTPAGICLLVIASRIRRNRRKSKG